MDKQNHMVDHYSRRGRIVAPIQRINFQKKRKKNGVGGGGGGRGSSSS